MNFAEPEPKSERYFQRFDALVQFANQKGTARQKALEVQNSITKIKIGLTAEAR